MCRTRKKLGRNHQEAHSTLTTWKGKGRTAVQDDPRVSREDVTVHIHIRAHAHTHTDAHTDTDTQGYRHTWTHTHRDTQAHIQTHMDTDIHPTVNSDYLWGGRTTRELTF